MPADGLTIEVVVVDIFAWYHTHLALKCQAENAEGVESLRKHSSTSAQAVADLSCFSKNRWL